ncbi:hypothetical protein [Mycetocola zhujimingii]|uniref:hypothetical protein n=1 Tax=Mycetocola zhujimingii TaxID=2079792 RepID=UPI0013C48A5C|nr:hypothetical protein [Mycetocola zhujimingii]
MTLATPQPAIETDPLVVAIVSVALTLIVGLVVGVVTALLARKGEHAKWLREQRYAAYVAFMIDMSTLTALLQTDVSLTNLVKVRARADAYTKSASAAFEAVSLLGPRKVNAAGQRWFSAANNYAKTKTTPARTALAEARWEFLIVAGEILNSKNVRTAPTTEPGSTSARGVTPAPR